KRMKSATPKVLHPVCGRPSIWHVLRAAAGARPATVAVVVAHGREAVEDAVRGFGMKPSPVFVDQGEPLGTGHAVAAAERASAGADDVLVMSGDDPLVTAGHVRELLRVHRRTKAAATILTTDLDDPTGYGRVIREGGRLVEIAEESDASPTVRRIHEVATLVYVFRREDLFKALPLVGRDNRQHEYYLHHVFPILREKGETVSVVKADLGGALGLNSRAGLANVSRIMRRRIVEEHLRNGVTFVDPDTAYVDAGVRIGADTVILPLTFLEGETRVGRACRVGPDTRLVDSVLDDDVDVTFAVVRGSRIRSGATVGPYASVRAGTVIEEGGKAGTFVELKQTRVGRGSKVPHLSYVGDATIGDRVNVGAGSITCNYDGYDKNRTVVGDDAFIGSDTMLVAPVRIGKNAWTGAGSVIAKDVPDGALAVERSEQRNVKGYDARKRAAHGGRAPGGARIRATKRGGSSD
ncbi:MAG TPA: bifunctional UDP-N-acetylglucosamine diphosphorylase/glucosamine-1-phosphate N-acetyltransferase GlmU, partial [Actinomycetota bacterium]